VAAKCTFDHHRSIKDSARSVEDGKNRELNYSHGPSDGDDERLKVIGDGAAHVVPGFGFAAKVRSAVLEYTFVFQCLS
jgi:hypothetical protein